MLRLRLLSAFAEQHLGYDKKNHYCQKVYIDHQMTAYIDYQCGYRYSMQHDDTYVWIGLFLVDENKHRQGFGKAIIQSFINQLDNHYNHVQLACIEYNEKGMAFWQSLGFYRLLILILERFLLLFFN